MVVLACTEIAIELFAAESFATEPLATELFAAESLAVESLLLGTLYEAYSVCKSGPLSGPPPKRRLGEAFIR